MHSAVHLSHSVLYGVYTIEPLCGLLQDGKRLDGLDVEVSQRDLQVIVKFDLRLECRRE